MLCISIDLRAHPTARCVGINISSVSSYRANYVLRIAASNVESIKRSLRIDGLVPFFMNAERVACSSREQQLQFYLSFSHQALKPVRASLHK